MFASKKISGIAYGTAVVCVVLAFVLLAPYPAIHILMNFVSLLLSIVVLLAFFAAPFLVVLLALFVGFMLPVWHERFKQRRRSRL